MSKTQVKSNDRFSKFRMESPLGKFFTILLYVVMTIIVLIFFQYFISLRHPSLIRRR